MGKALLQANGEAQPPADEYGVLNRYGEPHETGFQNRRDSAGRLERNVGREQTSIITFRMSSGAELSVGTLRGRTLLLLLDRTGKLINRHFRQ